MAERKVGSTLSTFPWSEDCYEDLSGELVSGPLF